MASRPSAPSQTFQAHTARHSYTITLAGDQLRLDGEVVEYTFAPLGDGAYSLIVAGRSLPVVVTPSPDGRLLVSAEGRETAVRVLDEKALLLERYGFEDADAAAAREVHAPMPGLVLKVLVTPGQHVKAGDGLVVLEAMKMENELRAPADAEVQAIHVAPGDAVSKNALLVEFA